MGTTQALLLSKHWASSRLRIVGYILLAVATIVNVTVFFNYVWLAVVSMRRMQGFQRLAA
jgi:hypothetical protein